MSNAANSLLVTLDRGIALIKEFEGLELEAYPDPGNKVTGEPWTIGYGHTHGVRQGDTCTEEQATEWLREDLKATEGAIKHLVDVMITQNQFDALASFVFNIGATQFGNSTLLRLLNKWDYEGAAEQFKRWNRGADGVLPGLVRRRAAERALFVEGAV
ncbi:lysozyme [Reyranella sp.]|uniref:lysozyme n=1 Tax=Reyranella sp. TaxID=1929291 RepID=UPI0025D4BD32|nr:lysozyme [Reyranella sp.]